MKWLALFACLFITASAGARLDSPPPDKSVPELVDIYITFPCDFLLQSSMFQEAEIRNIKGKFRRCEKWVDETEVKYGHLLCEYIKMQGMLMYDHLYSVTKAYDLMCNDDVTRKNPEYEINF